MTETAAPASDPVPPPPPDPASGPAIKLSGLSKFYGKVEALHTVDLEIQPGEVFGFLGPNGAGKSTTLRTMLGFLKPTTGTATVLGGDIRADRRAILRRIGYLPSGVAFDDTVTGMRALDELSRLGGQAPVRREELCSRLELSPEVLHRHVRDYSRGMRQKLGIVQALQHDPELLVLDEPTEGLDPLMQHAFYAILAEAKQAGRTIFFSSHILSEVERICDRVAIIRSGRLVATERVDELLAKRRRRAEVRFDGTPPDLSAVPGVSQVAVNDSLVSCRLQGDVRPFLAALAASPVRDLIIEPPHLEDIFLEIYSGTDQATQ